MRTKNGTFLSIYLSKSEKEDLDEVVAKSGQSRNSWLRSLIVKAVGKAK